MALAQFAGPLAPGRVLDLGCARGDDAVWLAGQGWEVTAVDISSRRAPLCGRECPTSWCCRPVSVSKSTISPRHSRMGVSISSRRASCIRRWIGHAQRCSHGRPRRVKKAGHLLIIEHASSAPWSWSAEDTRYPTAEETLISMNLEDEAWQRLCVCLISRAATGPKGQKAVVLDNVIFLKKLI